jgi:hypothetical protein
MAKGLQGIGGLYLDPFLESVVKSWPKGIETRDLGEEKNGKLFGHHSVMVLPV